ncbi:MAG: DPP IV N-terminal domain-containing protein [Balneolales bacterium]|nr:DPP IV N-terminal domain-containing protein [Balneolales bacterium]
MSISTYKTSFFILSFLMVLAACTPTQELQERTLSEKQVRFVDQLQPFDATRYEMADKMLGRNLIGLVHRNNVRAEWVSESVFWYEVNGRDGLEYYLVNAENRLKTPLFDSERLASVVNEHIGSDNGHHMRPDFPGISRISLSETASTMRFYYNNQKWELDLQTYELAMLEEPFPAERPRNSLLSPDGKYAAFIKENNLWVRNMITAENTQLSHDGSYRFGYATDSQGWTNSDRPILKWSENGHMISTYQLDERTVEEMHMLRTADGRPELISWPYALSGDEHVPMHHRVVFDVENEIKLRLQTEPYHQRTSNCCGLTRGNVWADNQFIDSNRKLAYVSTSRDYKEAVLKIADLSDGSVREIFTYRDEIFIETNLNSRGIPNWRVLYERGEFIWFSRESDWGHLYMHSLEDGSRLHSITEGEWNVSDILKIDTAKERIWFSAAGMDQDRDPYQEYIYSIKFDGSGLRLHTPDEGHHTVVMSPDATFFVNSFSSFTEPQKVVLRDTYGQEIMMLEETDISDLKEAGWSFPVPFTAKARDGETDIYGLMFKPVDFDPNKSYPIINSIYPGPQIGSVGTRGFATTRRGQAQALAELGFIVVQIDALGTPMRSRSFHTAYYGDMSDNGLPDQIAAMQQLAERHSFIDIDRAGMYGHSGGGFATAAAMFNYPDFFKVGVAGAGNMDNRGYTFYWGEKFQGPFTRFEDGTDSFTNQALQLQVEGLRGHLLLSYGTLDNNVHPNTTLQVINELIAQNKDFDLIVMPNRNHGYANESYKLRRTWDYFVRHLHNLEPPKEYEFR